MRKRSRNRKKIRVVFSLTVCLLLLMTAGYAAFSTNITLTAKGNIVNTPESCFTTTNNDDGTLSITDYDATCSKSIKIPSTIGGKKVTKIAAAEYTTTFNKSFANKGITKVIIPEGITEIGEGAFNSNSIGELKLPTSIKKLGNFAFRHNAITKLELPDKYIEFKDSVFNDNKLSDEDAFIYKRNLDGTIDTTVLVSYGGLKNDKIIIPENVSVIDRRAFRAIYGIKGEMVIPDNVTKIEYQAFEYISYLDKVTIGNGVQTVGFGAFGHCASLASVEIGSGIQSIEENAFENDTKLTSIIIHKKEGTIKGAPWGAINAKITWTG